MPGLSPSQIEAIIFDVLPDESELAGEAHVAAVAASSARGESVILQPPSSTGYRLAPEAAMLAVAAAANFIKVCVEIYFTLKKARETKPSQNELEEKALEQSAGVGESAAKLAASVYKALTLA
jgi:hypothetical protein